MTHRTWAGCAACVGLLFGGCAGASPATGDGARIAALETRLARLEDTQQIEHLFRAYGYYFDKGLWHPTLTVTSDTPA